MSADRRSPPPSLRDLLLSSDFGRANPRRVEELLDRVADPVTETRSSQKERRNG